jgi:hypothetical protein
MNNTIIEITFYFCQQNKRKKEKIMYIILFECYNDIVIQSASKRSVELTGERRITVLDSMQKKELR